MPRLTALQPKEIADVREFLQMARRQDAKCVRMKKDKSQTKFKIRCSKDSDKASKLIQSLPPNLDRKEIN